MTNILRKRWLTDHCHIFDFLFFVSPIIWYLFCSTSIRILYRFYTGSKLLLNWFYTRVDITTLVVFDKTQFSVSKGQGEIYLFSEMMQILVVLNELNALINASKI